MSSQTADCSRLLTRCLAEEDRQPGCPPAARPPTDSSSCFPKMAPPTANGGTQRCLVVLLVATFTFVSGVWSAERSRPEIIPDVEELVLDPGDPLNLTCRDAEPVAWCTDHTFTSDQYEETYEAGQPKPYVSTLMVSPVNHSHVGYFSCVHNTTENKKNNNCNVSDPSVSSVYLYVKDPTHLLVAREPYYNTRAIVGQPLLLPCKPTFPEVTVTLTKSNEYSKPCVACTYDPREGFTITATFGFSERFCRGEYNGQKPDIHDMFVIAHER